MQKVRNQGYVRSVTPYTIYLPVRSEIYDLEGAVSVSYHMNSDGWKGVMKRVAYGISPFTHFHTGKLGVCFGPFFTLNTLRYPG